MGIEDQREVFFPRTDFKNWQELFWTIILESRGRDGERFPTVGPYLITSFWSLVYSSLYSATQYLFEPDCVTVVGNVLMLRSQPGRPFIPVLWSPDLGPSQDVRLYHKRTVFLSLSITYFISFRFPWWLRPQVTPQQLSGIIFLTDRLFVFSKSHLLFPKYESNSSKFFHVFALLQQ